MDVFPLNSVERFVSVVALIFGLIFFSSMVSWFSAKMMQSIVMKQERSVQMSALRQFLSQHSISQELATSVQQQVTTRQKHKKALTVEDVPALSMLSLRLRMDVHYELCRVHLMS